MKCSAEGLWEGKGRNDSKGGRGYFMPGWVSGRQITALLQEQNSRKITQYEGNSGIQGELTTSQCNLTLREEKAPLAVGVR